MYELQTSIVSTTVETVIDDWEAPPPVQTRADRVDRPWGTTALALRNRPDEWARLDSGLPQQAAHEIATGRIAAFRPAGAFQAVTRNGAVYARYIGGDR